MNIDGSESKPDCKQDRSADDEDDDADAKQFFKHVEHWEHDLCCLIQNLRCLPRLLCVTSVTGCVTLSQRRYCVIRRKSAGYGMLQ